MNDKNNYKKEAQNGPQNLISSYCKCEPEIVKSISYDSL